MQEFRLTYKIYKNKEAQTIRQNHVFLLANEEITILKNQKMHVLRFFQFFELYYDIYKIVHLTALMPALDDMANFAAVNAVYSEFFTENCPARACFAAKALPKGALVEIEAIAAK